MSETELPQGIALTPLDDSFRQDPYPILDRLRDEAPVHHDSELGRYIYTKHDDVKQLMRDPELWSDPRKANPGTFTREFLGNGLGEDEEPSMLLMDEPGHRRLRSLVSGSFTPGAVEKWRPRTAEVVQRVLAGIEGDLEGSFEGNSEGNSEGKEFDLIGAFAGPVPTVVIAELLGIGQEQHAQFKQWSDTAVVAAFNPFPTPEQVAARDEANDNLWQFFVEEIRARRDNPGDDLLSDMIRAEQEGDRLSEVEMIRQSILLLVAGNVTTTDLIGNGVKALLDNPEQWRKLRDNPELIKNAVEEMLRFDSPVVGSGRIANRTVEVGGCPVHKGESLSTSLAAANRDPDVYPDPNRFDIEREDTHHQSFGGGRHLCLGAHLARLEAQEAILGLIAAFPELSLGERGGTIHSIPGFRGYSELWVKASA